MTAQVISLTTRLERKDAEWCISVSRQPKGLAIEPVDVPDDVKYALLEWMGLDTSEAHPAHVMVESTHIGATDVWTTSECRICGKGHGEPDGTTACPANLITGETTLHGFPRSP